MVASDDYPDGARRACGRRSSPRTPATSLVSLAEGWECVDWGGTSHAGGGSHGSLLAGDSLGPLLLVGFEPATAQTREQWRLCDVAGLVARPLRPRGRALRVSARAA